MADPKERRSGPYTISNVKKAEGPDDYFVTLVREGRTVSHVRVVTTPSASAYYNDPVAPRDRGSDAARAGRHSDKKAG